MGWDKKKIHREAKHRTRRPPARNVPEAGSIDPSFPTNEELLKRNRREPGGRDFGPRFQTPSTRYESIDQIGADCVGGGGQTVPWMPILVPKILTKQLNLNGPRGFFKQRPEHTAKQQNKSKKGRRRRLSSSFFSFYLHAFLYTAGHLNKASISVQGKQRRKWFRVCVPSRRTCRPHLARRTTKKAKPAAYHPIKRARVA